MFSALHVGLAVPGLQALAANGVNGKATKVCAERRKETSAIRTRYGRMTRLRPLHGRGCTGFELGAIELEIRPRRPVAHHARVCRACFLDVQMRVNRAVDHHVRAVIAEVEAGDGADPHGRLAAQLLVVALQLFADAFPALLAMLLVVAARTGADEEELFETDSSCVSVRDGATNFRPDVEQVLQVLRRCTPRRTCAPPARCPRGGTAARCYRRRSASRRRSCSRSRTCHAVELFGRIGQFRRPAIPSVAA